MSIYEQVQISWCHVTRITEYIFSRVRSRGIKNPYKVLADSEIEHVIGHVICQGDIKYPYKVSVDNAIEHVIDHVIDHVIFDVPLYAYICPNMVNILGIISCD